MNRIAKRKTLRYGEVVPKQPKTTRAFRVDDEMWEQVRRHAAEVETNTSDVIRDALATYLRKHKVKS